jgi:chromate transport protein ChrA
MSETQAQQISSRETNDGDGLRNLRNQLAIFAAVSIVISIIMFISHVQLLRNLLSSCEPFFMRKFIWFILLITLLLYIGLTIFTLLIATGVIGGKGE